MPQKSWQLNRRTFLRGGAGISLGLPYLDCMADSSSKGAELPARLACFYFPYGIADLSDGKGWWPTGEGRDFEFSYSLKPLEPHRNELTVFHGFEHARVKVGGHQSADFFLTGADTRTRLNSVSMDQVTAAHLGTDTRFPSLVLSSDGGVGSPGMSHTLSYTKSGRPLPGLADPQDIYQRLFGVITPEVRRQLALDRSALDLLTDSARSVHRSLGVEDRRTLDEYLTSVRTLETDVQRSQAWLDATRPDVDEDELRLDATTDGDEPLAYVRCMYDLIFHALRTDTTRVVTYQLSSMRNHLTASVKWPRVVGLGGDAHGLAHGGSKPGSKKAEWDRLLLEQWAHLIQRLSETREVDATLLDRTLLFYGSSNSRTHQNRNYPLLLSGGRRLGLQHGQYIHNPDKRPMADILFTMLQSLGVPAKKFADSTETLSDLVAG